MEDNLDFKRSEKEQIRKRYSKGRSEDAEYIPATKEVSNPLDSDKDMRVAVYARVSTHSKEQMSSQIMQAEHYTDFVTAQKGWELVNIYSDEGISGTNLKKRDAFRQMIEDCKSGGIDLIVVKSVSRSSDSDFLLDLMMTVAAEESRIKSSAMEDSIKKRFSREILLTPPLLGYDNDENCELVVNEPEARVVRFIFRMYQRGYDIKEVCEKLTSLGLSTKRGNKTWSHGSVYGILQNERHCGRVLTWKTYTTNYKTHKKRKNRGEREQWVYNNHHEAIISPDDFNAVQKMIVNAQYGGQSFMPDVNSLEKYHENTSETPR
jgi:DNA invertase Pin-like site-specific DNA recombinase